MQYRYKLFIIQNSVVKIFVTTQGTWIPIRLQSVSNKVHIRDTLEAEELQGEKHLNIDISKHLSGTFDSDKQYKCLLVREDCVWFNLDVVCAFAKDRGQQLEKLFEEATNEIL